MRPPDILGTVTRRGTFLGTDYRCNPVTGAVNFGRTWSAKGKPVTAIRVTLNDDREAHGRVLPDGRAVLRLRTGAGR